MVSEFDELHVAARDKRLPHSTCVRASNLQLFFFESIFNFHVEL